MSADAQDRLAAVVMFAVCPDLTDTISDGHDRCEQITARVAAALATVVAEARAEALREAADAVARARDDGLTTGETGHPTHPYIETWLRARADREQQP